MMAAALPRDAEITGLSADSRTVRPGFLFAALPGGKSDGRAFIPDALKQGAAAILAPTGTRIDGDAVLVTDDEPRRAFALLCAHFYNAQPATMAAVTGTNGKTSVVNFLRQIWTAQGLKAASMGTIGLIAPGRIEPGSLTTPDPVSLHRTLAELAKAGISHGAFEASSHGLAQFRLDGVKVSAAGFTNLTRDHLDYHGDMERYWQAKKRLFADILEKTGTAVVNADTAHAGELAALCLGRGQDVITFGETGERIRLVSRTPSAQGQNLSLAVNGHPYDVSLPLAGGFQASNALCALGLALATGVEEQAAVTALAGLEGVAGRLQKVAERANGAAIYVDYAHTPDALETVLNALRPHAARRLVVLFGCGGDRDPGKRPMMGAIAARLADRAIVTDDNPRSENAALIRAQILAVCEGATEIGDRRDAIRTAIAGLETGDLLLIAGKGHETGQIVGSKVYPFNDADEARAAVEQQP